MSVLRPLLAAAALIAVGCTAAPPAGVDAECYANRSWFPQRASEGVWDDCVRQLGEAWCRKCLWQ